MLHLIPAPLHRALLPLAHRVRRRWRLWRKVPLAGCSVIVTRPDGAVVLVRHGYGSGDWCLPGGGLGRGEEPEACARRELQEELGLSPPAMAAVATLQETISGSPHNAYLFHCICADTPRIDAREILEARFFASDALPEPLSAITRRRLDLWLASQQR